MEGKVTPHPTQHQKTQQPFQQLTKPHPKKPIPTTIMLPRGGNAYSHLCYPIRKVSDPDSEAVLFKFYTNSPDAIRIQSQKAGPLQTLEEWMGETDESPWSLIDLKVDQDWVPGTVFRALTFPGTDGPVPRSSPSEYIPQQPYTLCHTHPNSHRSPFRQLRYSARLLDDVFAEEKGATLSAGPLSSDNAEVKADNGIYHRDLWSWITYTRSNHNLTTVMRSGHAFAQEFPEIESPWENIQVKVGNTWINGTDFILCRKELADILA